MRRSAARKRGSRLVKIILIAVVIPILGIIFLSVSFLLVQREYALEQADDLLLYDATLLSQGIDATLEISELVLRNAAREFPETGKPEDERRALASTVFSVPGIENIYLLDGEGRLLFTVIQRRNPSLALPEDSLERLRSGNESDCLILDAPAEGGRALVLVVALRGAPVTRYAAVLLTRFEVQRRFTVLAPRSGSRFRLIDRAGNTFAPGTLTAGTPPVRGNIPDNPILNEEDLLLVKIALKNRPVVLQYFIEKSEVLGDWGTRAMIQGVTVFLFICLVAAILIFGLRQYIRASQAEKLEQELTAREALIREVHHRTKNNLANIQAVLSFALRDIPADSDPASNALKTSISRIGSISLIHDLLHRSVEKAEIDMTAYITRLVDAINGLYARNSNVGIRTDIQPGLLMPYENAMTCGMIINELVTNSFKYAFPEGSSGTVFVGCARDSDGRFRLTVSDDGIGFGAGSRTGTGMDLIRMLAKKLEAEHAREDNTPSGTVWRFSFAG